MKICNKCGNTVTDDAMFCDKCGGNAFSFAGVYNQPVQDANVFVNREGQQQVMPRTSKAKSIVSLVLSIFGLVYSATGFVFPALSIALFYARAISSAYMSAGTYAAYSMVGSIIAYVICGYVFAVLGIVLGAVAMGLSASYTRANGGIGNKMSKAGKVMGLIAVIFGVILFIFSIIATFFTISVFTSIVR